MCAAERRTKLRLAVVGKFSNILIESITFVFRSSIQLGTHFRFTDVNKSSLQFQIKFQEFVIA